MLSKHLPTLQKVLCSISTTIKKTLILVFIQIPLCIILFIGNWSCKRDPVAYTVVQFFAHKVEIFVSLNI